MSAAGRLPPFPAGAKDDGRFPRIPQVASRTDAPSRGDVAAYIAAQPAEKQALAQKLLSNKVKKCPKCGKPNAFTLGTCNQCGTSLAEVPISFSNNIFTSFLFGIEKGPFPFTISIRYQDPECIVFDDLLALAPCHINVIPAKDYIPDWRYLLRSPAAGLGIIESLITRCRFVAQTQFFDNEAWRTKFIRSPAGLPPLDASRMAAGFNYPPSQYQLHIQFMSPTLLPFQTHLYRKGVHFTVNRFFPYHYVATCLQLAIERPLPAELLLDDTPVEAIIQYFKDTHGYNYETVHARFYSDFEKTCDAYSNWLPDDFTGQALEGEDGVLQVRSADSAAVDGAPVVTADKGILQSYGFPLRDGRTTGSYYAFPKTIDELRVW